MTNERMAEQDFSNPSLKKQIEAVLMQLGSTGGGSSRELRDKSVFLPASVMLFPFRRPGISRCSQPPCRYSFLLAKDLIIRLHTLKLSPPDCKQDISNTKLYNDSKGCWVEETVLQNITMVHQ